MHALYHHIRPYIMTSSYWSVDAFLSENTVSGLLLLSYPDAPSIYAVSLQRLPCTFLLEVPNLGHLEGTTERDVGAYPAMMLPGSSSLNFHILADQAGDDCRAALLAGHQPGECARPVGACHSL